METISTHLEVHISRSFKYLFDFIIESSFAQLIFKSSRGPPSIKKRTKGVQAFCAI